MCLQGVGTYEDLQIRFDRAFRRVQRAEPQFLEQLMNALPLTLSDSAVEEIARPLGWHDTFMRPVSLCLAKAPGSGDVGRMLQGQQGPKAAMPPRPATAHHTAQATPPPPQAKAITAAPILVAPAAGPTRPATIRGPPPPQPTALPGAQATGKAMGAAPANTPLTVGKAKAVPAMPSRASPDHIVQDPVVGATLAPDVAGGPEHAPNVGGPAPVPNQEARPPTAPSGETGLPQGQAIQAEAEAVELPICLICQDAVILSNCFEFQTIVLSSIVLSSIDNCVVLN